MTIGLIDVDGHNFPNLALMKLSGYHKHLGDDVRWWNGFETYDVVYMSKVFDETYSADGQRKAGRQGRDGIRAEKGRRTPIFRQR